MEKQIEAVCDPTVLAAVFGFATTLLVLLTALLLKRGVITKADVDTAVVLISRAKEQAADMKKTMSDITDGTGLNILQVAKIADEVIENGGNEELSVTASRAFRKIRKGILGF